MLDIAQKFSAGGLTNVLFTVMALWMVWPIICGVLGASRGGVGSGIMHGIMWGPVALPIVLLSGKKHICPTCGKRTLSTTDAERLLPGGLHAGFPPSSTAVARPCPAPDATQDTAPAATPAAAPFAESNTMNEGSVPSVLSAEQREEVVAAACTGYNETEAARLRQWLNGEVS